MAVTTMVHVLVVEGIKSQATERLASVGLATSDAVRAFLARVVAEQQLPFVLQAPNATTRVAMREARAMGQARFSSTDAWVRELERGIKRWVRRPAAGV